MIIIVIIINVSYSSSYHLVITNLTHHYVINRYFLSLVSHLSLILTLMVSHAEQQNPKNQNQLTYQHNVGNIEVS